MEYEQDFKNYDHIDDIYADLWNEGYGDPCLLDEGETDIVVYDVDEEEFYKSQMDEIFRVYVGDKYAYILIKKPDYEDGASCFAVYPVDAIDYEDFKNTDVESIKVVSSDHPDFQFPSKKVTPEPEFDGIEIFGCRSVKELEIKLSGLEAMADIYHRTPHFPRNGTPYDDKIKKIKRFLRSE